MPSIDLLCPGPDLKQHLKLRTAVSDITIGINAAPRLSPVDWWVIGDVEALTYWPDIIPNVGIFHQTSRNRLPGWANDKLVTHWDTVRCDPRNPYKLPWNLSMVAAMGLCSRLAPGCTVHVYGATWAGTEHCAPTPPTNADRWTDERRLVTACASFYNLNVERYIMHPKQRNRLATDTINRALPRQEPDKSGWQTAPTVMVQERRVLCPKCGSPKTTTYKTMPDTGTDYRRCNRCGEKFADQAAANRVRLLGNLKG